MPQTHVMTHLANYAATRVTVESCPLARKVDRIYLKINYNSNLRVGVVQRLSCDWHRPAYIGRPGLLQNKVTMTG